MFDCDISEHTSFFIFYRQPFKPLMDPEVVKQFLMGEYCLYGGSGWWKYEFCYGKKVDQYHEEKGGQRTVINLGRFDEQKHLGRKRRSRGMILSTSSRSEFDSIFTYWHDAAKILQIWRCTYAQCFLNKTGV